MQSYIDTAAILAGGFGTRLRSVVSHRPKVMALVAGRPFLTHLLDQLVDLGIGKVILCTGYMAELIQEELGSCYRGIEIVYSVEKTPLGTGGALRNAAPLFSGNTLLVLNGDSYCHCDIAGFFAAQSAGSASAGIVLAQVDDVARFGAVQVNAESRVQSFVEKGVQTGKGLINAGIYLLPTARIMEIAPDMPVSLEREVIPRLIADGIYGYQCSGAFIDIGIPEEYERAQLLFSNKMKGKP